MEDQVWLVVDAATAEVSYMRHGREGDEANWRTVGPFAFTSKEVAESSIQDPNFLPPGADEASFSLLNITPSSFIKAVYNGFHPVNPDVLVLNLHLLPLSRAGAEWIDEAQEVPIWSPLFDEDGEGAGLDWLDKVLQLIANHLNVTMETVQAIGLLSEEDDVEENQNLRIIEEHVRITLLPEPGTTAVGGDDDNLIIGPEASFWLYTMGMDRLGLPELEMRNVPGLWITAAGQELLRWAVFALEEGLEDGEVNQSDGPLLVDIASNKSPDPFWAARGKDCLRLEVVQMTFSPNAEDDEEIVDHEKTIH